MRFAETGYNLVIDLSKGSVERIETDPKLTELYLGGAGTAAKIIWDWVPPDVAPSSPDNVIIFSAGLLCGTLVPGANRTMVNSISPQTNLWVNAMLGGYFASEMKHAGYDKIIITGKSPGLVYLWINNDKIEIRDASHLKGKGAEETQRILQEELDSKAQVAAIGLAGENRVFGASIEHAKSAAARMAGEVMGDKGLKAIAIRGTKDITIANPAELWNLCEGMVAKIEHEQENFDSLIDNWNTDNFTWGNARIQPDNKVELKYAMSSLKWRLRWNGCFNCHTLLKLAINLENGQEFYANCLNRPIYSMASYENNIKLDYEMVSRIHEYGLDGFITFHIINFAVELYEAGILTDEELPDFPAANEERFFYLLDLLVHRKGFVGDALAHGVSEAARLIGKGAEKFAITKKDEQIPLKLGKLNYPYNLMYAMYDAGEKMSVAQVEGSASQAFEPDGEKGKWLAEGWKAAPELFKDWFLAAEPQVDNAIEESRAITDWNEMMYYINDAVGLCTWMTSTRKQTGCRAAYYHMYNLPEFINQATGQELTMDELWEIALRIRTLVRAINNRRGLRKLNETLPNEQWKIREPEIEQEMLSAYYKFKGWTNDAIPTHETLEKLGLDYVSKEFIGAGILSGDEGNN